MWLFTTCGFFSIVQKKPTDTFLTVRARVRTDLDNLRDKYMPELEPTSEHGGTDYPYRATIRYEEFTRGMVKLAQDIHYPNFKDEVARQMGWDREHVYAKVWGVLKQLEDL